MMSQDATVPIWTYGTSLNGYRLVLDGGCWKIRKPERLTMETILQEVERALQAKLYYLALVVALTLPDICVALESADGQTTGLKYRAWFERYLQAKFPMLTPVDCYSLRCGVVHQGRFGHPKLQYDRVIFGLPDQAPIFHGVIAADNNNTNESHLMMDAVLFCRDIMDGVRSWFEIAEHDPIVRDNLPRLVQLRPTGIVTSQVSLFGKFVIA